MWRAGGDEFNHGFLRDQMAIANIWSAERFCNSIQEHQAFTFFGGEEFQEGIQIHWRFVGDVVIHPIEEHKRHTRFQGGFGKRDFLFDSDGQAGGVIAIADDDARNLYEFMRKNDGIK